MSQGLRYRAKLYPERSKYFKKKVLLPRQIPVNREYSFQMSIWIADTPAYRARPSIVVSLSHNGERLSFSFNSIADLVYAFGEMERFVSQKAEMLHGKQQEAIKEWEAYHQTPSLYEYTDTVIQGDDGDKMVIDRRTGEILGRLTPMNDEDTSNTQKQEK